MPLHHLQEFRAFVADQKKKTETVVHTLPPASQVAPLYKTTHPTVGHSTWIPAGNLPIAQGKALMW